MIPFTTLRRSSQSISPSPALAVSTRAFCMASCPPQGEMRYPAKLKISRSKVTQTRKDKIAITKNMNLKISEAKWDKFVREERKVASTCMTNMRDISLRQMG